MKNIIVYSFNELSDEAKQIAIKNYRKYNESILEDIYRMRLSDIYGSFETLMKKASIDFIIKSNSTTTWIYINLDDNILNLSGKRAWAWFENNLFQYLRIPFIGKRRWDLSKYGISYRAGMIKPCPFTGMCYDEDFIDYIYKELRTKNNTINDILKGLHDYFQDYCESEYNYVFSDEFIIDDIINNDYNFTENGQIIE